MGNSLEIFIPVSFFVCVVLCIYFIYRFRYEAIIKLGGPIPRNPSNKRSWKRIGIVVIGFALGLLIVGFLFEWNIIQQDDISGFFIVGIISLTTGLAILQAEKIDPTDKQIDG